MKKLLAILLSLMLVLSLVACGDNKPKETDNKPVNTENQKEEGTTGDQKEEGTTEGEKEEGTTGDEKEEGTTGDQKEEENTNTGSVEVPADIANAIDGTTSTEETPVALNQWVKATNYATKDKTYHTVYVRVVKVTTMTQDENYVNQVIDKHNEFSNFRKINLEEIKLPADVELCVLDYEVYVPEDFPSQEYGIVTPDVDFSAANIGGGGIPSADGASVYIGLTTMTNMETEEKPEYMPGNTYSFKSLYKMVKGYENYLLCFGSYLEGTTELTSEKSYKVYYQIK